MSDRLNDLKGLQLGMLSAIKRVHDQRTLEQAAELTPRSWSMLECGVLIVEINRRRECLRKVFVKIEDVERVQRMAHGHSDYATKFALYCAELVLQP